MLHKSVAKVMVAGLLCLGSVLPSHAADKMAPKMAPKMAGKIQPKMAEKMGSHKMAPGKMAAHKMPAHSMTMQKKAAAPMRQVMSPSEKRTESMMSAAEKALLMKVAHASSMPAGKMRAAMTPAEKRTQTMMSPAEKALLTKMGKASGRKMSGGMKPKKM